jgi:hypothetical protein
MLFLLIASRAPKILQFGSLKLPNKLQLELLLNQSCIKLGACSLNGHFSASLSRCLGGACFSLETKTLLCTTKLGFVNLFLC